LETAMKTIFSIVVFFTFLGAYTTGVSNWLSAVATIAEDFGVGIVIGALLGSVWVYILHFFQKQKFTYVLTLGLIFITYALSTRLGGNGELSVIIFGIILGNYYLLRRITKHRMSMDALQKQLGAFQEEISFLMETLFFVFLGLTFVIDPAVIISDLATAAVVVAVLLGVRYVATSISTFPIRNAQRTARNNPDVRSRSRACHADNHRVESPTSSRQRLSKHRNLRDYPHQHRHRCRGNFRSSPATHKPHFHRVGNMKVGSLPLSINYNSLSFFSLSYEVFF
jgi:NhaP-type Na+/H+ or K+/H+ antiporter